MRVMAIVKASTDSEAGAMPKEEMLAAMGQFNEELAKAGVMVGGEGLHPSSKGARVSFGDGEPRVTDGPFAETKELIAGFWILQVDSFEDAVEWMKKCPDPHDEGGEIEIRQVFEAEDFGEEFTPELREQEDRIRAQSEQNQ
jgi:hypothetical protein